VKSNWQYLLLSFILALVSWYFVTGREKVDAWIELPVQYTAMPDGLVILDGMQDKVRVRVRGPKGLIHGLDSKTLAYSLDLSRLKVGQNILPILPEDMPLAKTFEVVEINPARLQIQVDKLAFKTVPVVPIWEGDIDPDYWLVNATATPAQIEIRGPEKMVSEMQNLHTQAVTVDSTRPGFVTDETPLNMPESIEAKPGVVTVSLQFAVRTKELSLSVPVDVANLSPLDYTVKPKKVRLHVEAPLPLTRQENVSQEFAVQVTVPRTITPGEYELPARPRLPNGCQLLSMEPLTISVTLLAQDASGDAGAAANDTAGAEPVPQPAPAPGQPLAP